MGQTLDRRPAGKAFPPPLYFLRGAQQRPKTVGLVAQPPWWVSVAANPGPTRPLTHTAVLTRIEFVPSWFTSFAISPWSTRFGAGLEIRRTRLRVPYILDHFPPINSPFPMRILPKSSRRLLASCRHWSNNPRHLASIQHLDGDTRPATWPLVPFPELDHRQKLLALPFWSTRTTFPSWAPQSISPLQVSKTEFILLRDYIGGNLAWNHAP
jgi:hypothetical protein